MYVTARVEGGAKWRPAGAPALRGRDSSLPTSARQTTITTYSPQEHRPLPREDVRKRGKRHYTSGRTITVQSFTSRPAYVYVYVLVHPRVSCPLQLVLRGYQFGDHAVGPTRPPKTRAVGGAFNGKRRLLILRF